MNFQLGETLYYLMDGSIINHYYGQLSIVNCQLQYYIDLIYHLTSMLTMIYYDILPAGNICQKYDSTFTTFASNPESGFRTVSLDLLQNPYLWLWSVEVSFEC